MGYEAINFGNKFGLFSEQWQPKVIAEMNDYQFKIAKLEGDFITRTRTRLSLCSTVYYGSIFATVRSTCRRAKCSSSRKASNTNPMPSTRSNCC
jgi:hypothetical protein